MRKRSLYNALFIWSAGLALSVSASGAVPQGAGRRSMTFFEFLLRPKFIVMLIIGTLVLALLLSRRMSVRIKVPILLLSTFLFGIAANLPVKWFSSFSMHPSPMCAATKSILYGFRIPMIATLAVILFLTVIGPKLFCGWVCPVGALQELIAMLADKLKIRRIHWNFTLTQGVRVGLFLLFIFLSGTAVLHITSGERIVPLSFYDYINAFHGFEWSLQKTLLDNLIHFLPFMLTVIFAFKFYRPFCYMICPVGLLTNIIEQAALFRIRLKRPPCNDCEVCEKKSPCPAVPEILKGSLLRPDCFSCDVCIQSCSRNALDYGIRRTAADKSQE